MSRTSRGRNPSSTRPTASPKRPTLRRRWYIRPALSGDRRPEDPFALPVLRGRQRPLDAVRHRLQASGQRCEAARGPARVLRRRPDHDGPLLRRRQCVHQCGRPGGSVPDQLQHFDHRTGRGQGDAADLRWHNPVRRLAPGLCENGPKWYRRHDPVRFEQRATSTDGCSSPRASTSRRRASGFDQAARKSCPSISRSVVPARSAFEARSRSARPWIVSHDQPGGSVLPRSPRNAISFRITFDLASLRIIPAKNPWFPVAFPSNASA